MRLDMGFGVVGRGDDEIFKHLALVGHEQGFVDLDAAHLAFAVQGHLHHTAAGAAVHFRLGELGLEFGHARLHLLRLFQHLAEIFHNTSSSSGSSSASGTGSAGGATVSRTLSMRAPGKASSTARTSGSRAASLFIDCARASACSFNVGSPASLETLTTQRWPVHCE